MAFNQSVIFLFGKTELLAKKIRCRIDDMNWITIYITGREDFSDEVLSQLEKSDLTFMPGTVGEERGISMLWIPEGTPLRNVKLAIGSRAVFKYRLRFFLSLEDIQQDEAAKQERFSPREQAMIREMKEWEQSQRYRHSA